MHLGFMTGCLPQLDLDGVAAVAEKIGFSQLEVACWPADSTHLWDVTHLDVDAPELDAVPGRLAEYGVAISALAYYADNLHPDLTRRARTNAHLQRCIEAAAALDVPTVCTFLGRDPGLSVAQNMHLAKDVFRPLTQRAGELGVRLAIENCPMEGWHVDGYPGNVAYCPELWEFMFEEMDLYLNYDPSHLVWLGIDPITCILPYADRIPHWQAKDVEVFPERRNRTGHFGRTLEKTNEWDNGWWRYRIPGLGQIDWPQVMDRFYEAGYRGTVSVEHEDPVWGGDEERIVAGLHIAHRTLSALTVDLR